MPINAKCPHCLKAYRFDEAQAGAVVKCDNPDCLKLFKCPRLPPKPVAAPAPAAVAAAPVAAAPKPAPPPPPKPKPAPVAAVPVEIDAETLAHQALTDEPAATAGPTSIPMTCSMCEHKWEVGLDKAGKNVLCPDCQHRQKVPELPKTAAGGWKSVSTGPSLAKQTHEVLTDVQGGKATLVSNRVLQQAGIFTEAGTLKPAWFWGLFVALPLSLVGIAAAATMNMRQTGRELKRDEYVRRAITEFVAAPDAVPANEAAMYRAVLHLAAGQYFTDSTILQGEDSDIEAARDNLQQARAQLALAGKSGERNAFWGELLAAQVALGGDDALVKKKYRLRWEEGPTAARVRINEKLFSVQEEVRQTLQAMADPAKGADPATRLLACRRLAAELAGRNKLTILTRVVHLAFPDEPADLNEARCLAGIEAARAGNKDEAQAVYDALKVTSPPPASGPLLAKLLDAPNPPSAFSVPPEPPATSPLTTNQRALHTKLKLLIDKKPDDAVEVALRDVSDKSGRLAALAWVLEWSAEPPASALAGAVKIAAEEPRLKPGGTPSAAESARGAVFVRFLPLASKANDDTSAEALLSAVADEGVRAWGRAEYARLKLASTKAPADEATAAPLPDDSRERKMGHAWARLALARHNAKLTGKRDAAQFERWGKGSFESFGLTGLALGLQDREKR